MMKGLAFTVVAKPCVNATDYFAVEIRGGSCAPADNALIMSGKLYWPEWTQLAMMLKLGAEATNGFITVDIKDPPPHFDEFMSSLKQIYTKKSYLDGLKEGLRMYAWWKDGVEYVGSCGTTLKKALADVEKTLARENGK